MRLPHHGSMKVDPVSGAFCYYAQDISIPCRGGMRIVISRSYDSTSDQADAATPPPPTQAGRVDSTTARGI